MNEVKIAGLGVSVLIILIMTLIFKTTGDKIPDRTKPLLSVACGIIIYICVIPYNGEEFTFHNVIDAFVLGLTYGLSAVGMYGGYKKTVNPEK